MSKVVLILAATTAGLGSTSGTNNGNAGFYVDGSTQLIPVQP